MSTYTEWGESLDPSAILPEYPRPQLVRNSYLNLNGEWQFAIRPSTASETAPASWDGTILVPFSPESILSGVSRQLLPGQTLWYRRELELPHGFFTEGRLLLNFGAVDSECVVLVNGTRVGSHEGGYLPFSIDITDAVVPGTNTLTVAVHDDTDTGVASRGKQKLDRGGIWYTAQSGIWQTVWLEAVPSVFVERLILTSSLENGSLEVTVVACTDSPATIEISADSEAVASVDVHTNIPVRIPLGAVRPWSPEDPFLYDIRVTLGTDEVTSYVGMRSFGTGLDAHGVPRLFLNGAPYFHAGVLDQGYWPDGLYTAPSDEAMIADIRAMKDLGFTMLRKHIKIEPLRWYAHCDRIGILVWQDMVNGGAPYRPAVVTLPAVAPVRLSDRFHGVFGRADASGRQQFRRELRETVALLSNVASIAMWVPFNEGWGQFDAGAITRELLLLDRSRTIDSASGWHDQGAGDVKSLHVYFRRFRMHRAWRRDRRVVVLSEYGGYSHREPGHDFSSKEFGYRRFRSRTELDSAFEKLHNDEILPAISQGLSATVYTQLADVEDELNGILTYDRRVTKITPDVVRRVNARLTAAGHTPGRTPHPMRELEITEAVPLTAPDGRLNPAAVGWSRTPMHRTDGIGELGRGWGRNKRWEYWAVMTPTHIVSATVSSLDYASVNDLWIFDRRTEEVVHTGVIRPLSGSVRLPATLGDGPAQVRTKPLRVDITEVPNGTRLRARTARVSIDILAARAEDHESLAVVVPWSPTRFQYTVKDVARPASGTIRIDGTEFAVPEGSSWATLDHGRGRWPYSMHWNWAAGSGVSNGRVIGVQLGSKWTDGTGSTENALFEDGRLSKISEELTWDYDTTNWLAPWHISGDSADLTFTPFYDKTSATDLKVFSSFGHQCFGEFRGWMLDESGQRVFFEGIEGWAEDVRNRW
ncbi:DUF2804 family protein [Mycetocola zhadangensis]|uniref:DUF2804 family protein n=1 Tax=Mycetocola zhadangensis TaxID=1164595 RepID=UPI003A4E2037